MAEEGIGLAKSLDWTILKGPFLSVENSRYQLNQSQKNVLERYRNANKEFVGKAIPKVLKNGDFFKEGPVEGVFMNEGVEVDLENSGEVEDEEDEGELSEWKSLSLRHSLAISSMVKINEIKASTYFNKNKLNLMRDYLIETPPNVVFVNTSLTITQKRNIEK